MAVFETQRLNFLMYSLHKEQVLPVTTFTVSHQIFCNSSSKHKQEDVSTAHDK